MGPAPVIEHVFAQHGKRQRGVHGVAEGVEDGRDFLVDARIMPPDIGHGQGDEFGECSGAIDADALCVRRKDDACRPGSCGSGRRPRGLRR